EGGGTTRAEQTPLREGFKALFDKVSRTRKPRVVCAGGRGQTFKEFKIHLRANPRAVWLLLVDSEGPVASEASPWDHVANRQGDGWQKPAEATDAELHFMVEAMEAWLMADPEALALYYGKAFKKDKLPQRANLEEVPKDDLQKAFEAATKDAKTK